MGHNIIVVAAYMTNLGIKGLFADFVKNNFLIAMLTQQQIWGVKQETY